MLKDPVDLPSPRRMARRPVAGLRAAAAVATILLAAPWLLTARGQEDRTAAGAGEVAVDWAACQLPGSDEALEGECATVEMPLFHGGGGPRTLEIGVARHRGDAGAATGTRLWYVDGGPGDAGTDALGRLREVLPDPRLDLYAVDHRGVGRSARLGCPQQEAEDSEEGREISATEWPACIEHLRATRNDLDALTTTQSARDLAVLIAAVGAAEPPARDVVLGASYGTWLVNRYLLLAPRQPDAVILDGLVPADWTFAELDAAIDTTARRLLARCAENAACAERLGADPAARARQLAHRVDEGHCSALGVDGRTVRLLLGNLVMGGPGIWPYVPTTIYRLEQCRLRDLLAVGSLVERLFESGRLGEAPSHSPVLQRHVALSEMWPTPPPDPGRLAAAADAATMTTGVSAAFARTAALWPRYPSPPLAGRFADAYDGPMLLLHGGLDPTMPPERLATLLRATAGPSTTFVLFPDRGHVAVNGNPCARSLYRAFLRDPDAPLDTSCVEEDVAFEPASLPPGAAPAFGTRDLWGDGLSPQEWQLIFFGVAAIVAMAATAWMLVRRWRRRRQPKRP